MIELNAPLIILDTETTGPHSRVDRIIQIAITKLYPRYNNPDWPPGKQTEWSSYINPTIPIPPEVIEIHGITDEKVKDAPTFASLAPALATGFKGCDFCGYNVDFDLDFLEAEFGRVTKQRIINGRIIDVFDIYRKYHPRSLKNAVKEYLGKELEGAHDAKIDKEATHQVLEAQLERHQDLPRSIEQLHRMFREMPPNGCVDPEGKLYWRYGEACLNFGDKAGMPLRQVDKSYLNWILSKDFPNPFKRIVKEALQGKYPSK